VYDRNRTHPDPFAAQRLPDHARAWARSRGLERMKCGLAHGPLTLSHCHTDHKMELNNHARTGDAYNWLHVVSGHTPVAKGNQQNAQLRITTVAGRREAPRALPDYVICPIFMSSPCFLECYRKLADTGHTCALQLRPFFALMFLGSARL
jgi:hypothetical protein